MRKIDREEFILTTSNVAFEILYDMDSDHLLIMKKGTEYYTDQKCKKDSSLRWLFDKNEKDCFDR